MSNFSTNEPITVSYSYPKNCRLLTSAQFKSVFDSTLFKCHQPYLMAFVAHNKMQQARLGLAITKKKVPTAVARNRLKRLIRERFRHKHSSLANLDIIFIVKKPINTLTNEQLVNEIDAILRKIQKRYPTST